MNFFIDKLFFFFFFVLFWCTIFPFFFGGSFRELWCEYNCSKFQNPTWIQKKEKPLKFKYKIFPKSHPSFPITPIQYILQTGFSNLFLYFWEKQKRNMNILLWCGNCFLSCLMEKIEFQIIFLFFLRGLGNWIGSTNFGKFISFLSRFPISYQPYPINSRLLFRLYGFRSCCDRPWVPSQWKFCWCPIRNFQCIYWDAGPGFASFWDDGTSCAIVKLSGCFLGGLALILGCSWRHHGGDSGARWSQDPGFPGRGDL